MTLSFCFLTVSAKKFNLDSLMSIAESPASNDSLRSLAFYNLSNYYLNDNPRKALKYINLSIQYFDKLNKKTFYYLRFVKKAQIFRAMGNLDSSIFYCNRILNQAIKDKDYINQNNVYSELGLIANSQDNYKKALHFFEKQTELIKKGLVKENPATVYNNMGIAYASMGESDMAFEFFRRALIHDQIKAIPALLGNDYNNLGIMFTMKGKLDSAEHYIALGRYYRELCNDMLGVGGSLNNLALINKTKKNYIQALLLADSAYSIAKKNEFKKLEEEVNATYNSVYYEMGDYKKAHEYLNKVFRGKQQAHRQELTGKVEQLESDIALQEKQAQILEGELQLEKAEKLKQKQTGVILLVTLTLIAALFFAFTFRKKNNMLNEQNILISEQKDIIEEKHFVPAIKAGIKEQKEEIKSIIRNVTKPDFENTILSLEHSGQIIRRTAAVLYNLSYANTSATLQDIMQKVAPSLSAHNDYIFMSASLFKRVKYIWDNQKKLPLKGEEFKLLELYYKAFVRNGANLKSNEKKRVAEINQRLSLLSLQFGKNILDTINIFIKLFTGNILNIFIFS